MHIYVHLGLTQFYLLLHVLPNTFINYYLEEILLGYNTSEN